MVCVTGNDLPVTRQQIVESLWGARETHPGKPESNTEAGGTYHKHFLSPTTRFQAQRVEAKKNPKDKYKQHLHSLAGNNQTFSGRMGLNRQHCRTCLGSAAFVEHCDGNGCVKNEPKSSESSVSDRPQVVFFQARVHLSG